MSKHLSTLALTVALVSVFGCQRAPDPAENVSKALRDANLEEVQVDWDKADHVAYLSGLVDRPTDRQRAEEIAESAVGTSGTVLNEIRVQAGDALPDLDSRISGTLKRMVQDDQALRGRDITFHVSDGTVVIRGEVQSVAEKIQITELARSVQGVRDVTNSLDVRVNQ